MTAATMRQNRFEHPILPPSHAVAPCYVDFGYRPYLRLDTGESIDNVLAGITEYVQGGSISHAAAIAGRSSRVIVLHARLLFGYSRPHGGGR